MPVIWNLGPDGSGTAQQKAWVQEAISACSYPLDKLNVLARVKWGNFPQNTDARHPYMVTNVSSDGWVQITIAPWADDPNHPQNQGLPNPAQDIKDFYKQSFVHELGHLVTFVTADPFNTGLAKTVPQMCNLFWRYEQGPGSGVRWGAVSDWLSLGKAWADEIVESVAEYFKISFYTGRLIFGNRTNWNLSKQQFAQFLKLLSSTTSTSATFSVGGGTVLTYPINPAVPLALPSEIDVTLTLTGQDADGDDGPSDPDLGGDNVSGSVVVSVSPEYGTAGAAQASVVALLERDATAGGIGGGGFLTLPYGQILIAIDCSSCIPDVNRFATQIAAATINITLGVNGNPFLPNSTAPVFAGQINFRADTNNAPHFTGAAGNLAGVGASGAQMVLLIDFGHPPVAFPVTKDFPFADPSISLGAGYRGSLRV